MKYPDGSTVGVGDVIWWDGGIWIIYVRGVFEREDEYRALGLDEPSIGASFYSGDRKFGVTIARRFFEEEGVGLLNPTELKQLLEKVENALEQSSLSDAETQNYTAKLVVETTGIVGWEISFYREKEPPTVVFVPERNARGIT